MAAANITMARAKPSVLSSSVRWTLLGAINLYRYALSPWLGPRCRYEPTCSRYAEQAVRRFGARRGLLLAVKRIGRCHPWGGSGYDPVPEEPRCEHRPSER
jgi:putative membrane protein insertion efficiency factor